MPERMTRQRRTWAQRAVLSINVVLAIACIGAGLGLLRVRQAIENMPVVDIGTSLTPRAIEGSAPRNVLIIGTDDASGIDKNDPVMKERNVGTQLADVIMILRVDPGDHSVRLLSIPRDSRVELPTGRMGRINAAMAGVGGPANLVRTIKRNFGIPIDNYVQLDFLGFRKLVEVLGGVPVYFTTPVRDRNSGLYIDTPGCHMLDPEQALAYARARHFYFYADGKWRPDVTADLGRITRQQDFIKRALRTAAQKGLRNPTTALGLVNAASSAVRMDSTLEVGSIVELVREFQDFNPDAIISMQVPTKAAPRGGVAYQDVKWSEAEPMLEQFRGVTDPESLEPAQIIVQVASSSADDTPATATAEALDKAGFDADTWRSKTRPRRTTLTYGPSGRSAAIRVAAQLQVMPEFVLDESITGFQVRLSAGTDFEGVRDKPLSLDEMPADRLPAPDRTGEGSATGSGSDQESTGGTTTTVDGSGHVGDDGVGDDPEIQTDEPGAGSPGVVPTDPEASAQCR